MFSYWPDGDWGIVPWLLRADAVGMLSVAAFTNTAADFHHGAAGGGCILTALQVLRPRWGSGVAVVLAVVRCYWSLVVQLIVCKYTAFYSLIRIC